jgi:hypothetical protein
VRARRLLLSLTALLAVPALVAEGATSTTLDGGKRREHTYRGSTPDSVLVRTEDLDHVRRLLRPEPVDCTPSSCDVSTLRLVVPKGRQSGRFTYRADFESTTPVVRSFDPAATAYVALYDDKGLQVAGATVFLGQVQFTRSRLAPGTYRLYVFNQGGPTAFEATVTWLVNPPHAPESR